MRKLASIRRIDIIKPIPGADAIECAVLGGWPVVIKKNEFAVGDLAVYIEIDSWVPTDLAPFLSKGKEPNIYNDIKGERLRSVRLRGQLSQGLLLPMGILENYARGDDGDGNMTWYDPHDFYQEGEDVTEVLGIVKWEPIIPACLAGEVKGAWPSHVQKTDQERAQNLGAEWDTLKTYTYEVTEKLEGSSMTAGIVNDDFTVCSRNLNLRETATNSLWAQARRYNIEARMRELGVANMVVQGEIIGEGIQGNHYGIKGQDFYVFDILNTSSGQYLLPADRRAMCVKLGLKHVPVLFDEFTIISDIEGIVECADGPSLLNTAKLREGIVFKRVDGPEHFKAVSNQYLIKTGN